MTDPLGSKLDAFERRLNELETELVQLRRAAVAGADQSGIQAEAATVTEEPVTPETVAGPALPHSREQAAPHLPAWVEEWFERVRQNVERDELRDALATMHRMRLQALSLEDRAALEAILAAARKLAEHTSGEVATRRVHLEYTIEHDIRVLAGKNDVPQSLAGERGQSTREQRGGASRRPAFELPALDVSDLLGARALAVAGGVVTLLGIVFFFVLAVNRGWIGAEMRVGLGATASSILFAAGLELRRRHGATHSALAAVGAGIAGGYITVLAAAALYDLISSHVALVAAAAISAAAVATSLRWRSEVVAGFGLIGAMLMPLAVAAQDELTVLGTAFAAVMLVATMVAALRQRWAKLLVAGVLVSAPQIAALVAQERYAAQGAWRPLALAGVFSALYLVAGIAHELRRKAERLERLSVSLVALSALLAAGSSVRLFGGLTHEGIALLAITALFTAVGVGLRARPGASDLSAFTAAIALVVAAVAAADLLSGQTLAIAWAAEAAALAWLARRLRDVRFQIWSIAYVGLSATHIVLFDAPPRHLFIASPHPAAGAPTAVALAIATAIVAFYAQAWNELAGGDEGPTTFLASSLRDFQEDHQLLRAMSSWLAAALASYGASLGILGAFASFDWGHVAVAGLWGTIGVGLVLAGCLRGSAQVRLGGVIWLGVAVVAVVWHGEESMAQTPRGWAFATLAAALFVAGLVHQLVRRSDASLDPFATTLVIVIVSVVLSFRTVTLLLSGDGGRIDHRGVALLGIALLYGAITTALFRRGGQRDFTSLLGTIGLLVGLVAAVRIFDDTYLVLALAVGGSVLAWLSARTREPRLWLGAVAYIALAIADAVVIQSPPGRLFSAQLHAAVGVPALLCGVGALAVLGWNLKDEQLRLGRIASLSLGGLLLVYALSITLLDLVERASPNASLHTAFQRGHTAVSAFWGAIGLALLYAGLRRWRGLRLAGLAAFGVGLVKIFLYDLPSLSSITRALSFLAVGAVLLLGGFFYQRLAAEPRSGSDPV